jgi:hypothetical protein
MRREAQFQHQYEADIGEIKRGLDQLHGRISSLGNGIQVVVRGAGGALIIGLASLVAWLLAHGRPWEQI